jgi:bacterioferritin
MPDEFVLDLNAIRERARRKMDDGAVTPANRTDVSAVIEVLNEALATEIVCVLRYKNHYYMAQGLNAGPVAAEFLEHAAEEQDHADRISERIVQLGGKPNLNPEGLQSRAHSEYVEADTLRGQIKEDLVAERIAIESYTEIIRWLGDRDPTTRRLMEDILSNEEEHADDLSSLLTQIPEPAA